MMSEHYMASFSMFYCRINVRHHNGAQAEENSACLKKCQTKEIIIKFSAVWNPQKQEHNDGITVRGL